MLLNINEYIYKDCSIRMSKMALADIMYAAIITKSGLPTSYGTGIYERSREQNAYNRVEVKVHIHPSQIENFEAIAGVKLNNPIKIQVN